MPDEIFFEGQHLPAFPRVVTELLATFKREDCTAEEIAKIISSDAVLSAKILRMANSAYYRRSRGVTSVRSATVIIGYVPLRLMVASLGVAGSMPKPEGLNHQRFWGYSLNTAVLAQHLARRVAADPETAFSAGLLHGVGHPVMRAAMPQACERVEQQTPFYARERAAMEAGQWGFDFAQIGGMLAERWSFPDPLSSAIRYCVSPLKAPVFQPLNGIVGLARGIAAAIECGVAQPESGAFVDIDLLRRLKLSVDDIRAIPPVTELASGMESLVQ